MMKELEWNGVACIDMRRNAQTKQIYILEINGRFWATVQNSNAADALTLDEIYSKAKNEWLVKRKNVTNYFEAKNDGLISTCGYVEKGCVDDCFAGITIKSIQSL